MPHRILNIALLNLGVRSNWQEIATAPRTAIQVPPDPHIVSMHGYKSLTSRSDDAASPDWLSTRVLMSPNSTGLGIDVLTSPCVCSDVINWCIASTNDVEPCNHRRYKQRVSTMYLIAEEGRIVLPSRHFKWTVFPFLLLIVKSQKVQSCDFVSSSPTLTFTSFMLLGKIISSGVKCSSKYVWLSTNRSSSVRFSVLFHQQPHEIDLHVYTKCKFYRW